MLAKSKGIGMNVPTADHDNCSVETVTTAQQKDDTDDHHENDERKSPALDRHVDNNCIEEDKEDGERKSGDDATKVSNTHDNKITAIDHNVSADAGQQKYEDDFESAGSSSTKAVAVEDKNEISRDHDPISAINNNKTDKLATDAMTLFVENSNVNPEKADLEHDPALPSSRLIGVDSNSPTKAPPSVLLSLQHQVKTITLKMAAKDVPVASKSPKPKLSGSPGQSDVLNSASPCKHTSTYNREEAREFIKKQQAKRKAELAEKGTDQNEVIKARLTALKNTQRQLVRANVQKRSKKSFSGGITPTKATNQGQDLAKSIAGN